MAFASVTDGNGISTCDKRYCRSEYHAVRKVLAFSKPAGGARSPENTAGKVCFPVSVRHLFLGATFCIICDWGRNEPDRDYPVGAADTIRAGAGNGQFRNICATPAP